MAGEERERKRQAIGPARGRTEWRREFTIYIENLPLDMGSQDLRNILQQAGQISDVYIPQRLTRKTGKKFGFVRFWKVEEVEKCIYMFNNQFLRGKKIMANREETLDNSKEVKLVKEEVNKEHLNWLKRSPVCVSDEPRELDVLQTALNTNFPRFTNICALDKFKFIFSCETEEEMEDILENHQETDHWFHSIRKWSNSETCATRTWIEVFGVPPQAWTRKNFGSIAKHWGTFVSLGKPPEPWDPNSSDLEDSMNNINQNRNDDDMDRQVAKFDDMANANDDTDAMEESHELGDGRSPKVMNDSGFQELLENQQFRSKTKIACIELE
ncbi:hypothetical protein Cgig2_001479 [Carnegiea gigantea]|uniref:RRM domain-containing protein n=1 Tax=Carnegiea gigantea TaxID=171969 RepID=A0A9Q1KVU4_9CARY|nr:hypothetical protein Cgig2_001479 [Carnegiea gigantea]